MSDLEKKFEEKKEELRADIAGEVAKVKRSLAKRMLLWIGWTVAVLLVTVLVLFGLFAWYSKTDDFNRRVGRQSS
jgi:translocation and assembly module TamB